LNFRFWSRALGAASLILALDGCQPAVLVVPSYIKSVGIEVFQNKTSQYGLDTMLTDQLIRQFQVDGRLPLEDVNSADLIVKAVVTRYVEEPMLYDPKTNF